MSEPPPNELLERLRSHGQEHAVRWWGELDDAARNRLAEQLAAIDFETLHRLRTGTGTAGVAFDRIQPPSDVVRLPSGDAERERFAEAARRGEAMLAAGTVACILVAGGQGTRLGYDHPKGMFPVGPMTGAPLFEGFAHQLRARARRAGKAIPYFVMTSDATHAETVAFFEERSFFGLDPAEVHFFQQGTMPAVDAETGRLLLAEKGQLATSPDGHGGVLAALQKAGLLELCADRGIERIFYHQVDNPLTVVCDPVFLGFHDEFGSRMSTKVVAKRTPEEKMGVVVDVDGVTQVVEYSDLPDEIAARRTDDGELEIWAGSTAIHVFDRAFLETLLAGGADLPFHVAHKKVPFVDESGTLVEPDSPNANKFEKFIFDAMSRAETALVVEAERREEFAPVKNAFGTDSPATSLCATTARNRRWLASAGVTVADHVPIEIDPLFALDAAELVGKVERGTRFQDPLLLK